MENITEPQEKNNLYNAALFIDYENVYKNYYMKTETLSEMDFLKKYENGVKKIIED